MNSSSDFGGVKSPPRSDCLVVMPDVTRPARDERELSLYQRSLEMAAGHDLPVLSRKPADNASSAEVLTRFLMSALTTSTAK